MPQIRQVAGMNWVQPIAPADDGPMLQPKPDSICVIAVRICQRMPNALPAAFQVRLSGAAPEQRRTVGSPVRTRGLRPSDMFDRDARPFRFGTRIVPPRPPLLRPK